MFSNDFLLTALAICLTLLVAAGAGLLRLKRLGVQAEQRMRHLSEALRVERDLFSAGPVVVITWSPETHWPIRQVSSNVAEVFGYPPEEMLSPSFRFAEMIHPEDRSMVELEVLSHIRDGIDRFEQSYRIRKRCGDHAWFGDFTQLIRDAQGTLVSIRGYLFDQDRVKQLELTLAQERQSLLNIFWGTGAGTWEWNVRTGEIRVNERWAEMLGYSLSELSPTSIDTWIDSTHPDDLRRAQDALTRHFNGELDDYECELRMRHRDGHWVWITDRGRVSERTPEGEPLWMAGTHIDISQRKQTEAALLVSEQRLNTMFEIAPVGISITDEQGQIIDCNPASERLLGITKAEHLARDYAGKEWEIFCDDGSPMPPESFPSVRALAEKRAISGVVMEVRTPSGSTWLLVSATPLNLAGYGVIVVYVDISEQKRIGRALELSEERYMLAVKGSNDGLWDWYPGGNRLFLSAQWKQQLGYEDHELENDFSTFQSLMHPEDWPSTQALVQRYLGGELDQYINEFRLRHKNGSYRWILARGEAVRDAGGLPVRMAGSHTDITERKQAEQALAQQRDQLARSNAELEQFAYVASHDLRQPLRMINSYVQLIDRRMGERLDEETRQMMGFVTDGARRMDQMLVSLLEYSRVGRGGEPMEWLDSRAAVDEALRFLAPAINEAGAEVRIEGDWPRLLASRDEFTRLFQNLIGNAIKYRDPSRAPVVDLAVTSQDGHLCFMIGDNGIGIAPEQFERLFKVFQRLHARGTYEGNGIGLAVCRKIVERHAGRIWVESEGAGQGCRFRFTLPRPEHA